MVLLGAISVNVQAWVIGRTCGWKLDWLFQVVGISLMIAFGYVARFAAGMVWDIDVLSPGQLLVPVVASGFVYAGLALVALWQFPWLVGLKREELSGLFASVAARGKSTMEV
jgi:hypothetical protein